VPTYAFWASAHRRDEATKRDDLEERDLSGVAARHLIFVVRRGQSGPTLASAPVAVHDS
jgi:hypothetical protein